jgi:hypothetical protein
MTAIDDLSTVGDDYSSKAYSSSNSSSSVEERIAYLHGKLDTQQAFFRDQITEWKSRVDQLEHENRTWKATVQQQQQQDQQQIAALHEQMTELKSHVLACRRLLKHDGYNLHVTNKAGSSSSTNKMAEQCAESQSSEARSEHEILISLKTAMEQMVQEKVELVVAALLHEQITELQANVTKLVEENVSLQANKMEQQHAALWQDKNPQMASPPTKQQEQEVPYFDVQELGKLVAACNKRQNKSSPSGLPTPMLPNIAPVFVWKSSGRSIATGRTTSDPMVDVLAFPGFQRDTYCTWSIKILRAGEGLRLGVVTAPSYNHLQRKNRGEATHSWGYGGGGDAWPSGTGSIVTLRLVGETMSVSIDGKPMELVFDYIGRGSNKLFPAAFLLNGSSIEFLGFQG